RHAITRRPSGLRSFAQGTGRTFTPATCFPHPVFGRRSSNLPTTPTRRVEPARSGSDCHPVRTSVGLVDRPAPSARHEEVMSEPLTVLFMPESAYGPTNNCVGIGDVLRRSGHRVVFAAEASWAGRLEPLGFVEDLVDLAPPPEPDPSGAAPDAGQFWKDFIRDTAPEFR